MPMFLALAPPSTSSYRMMSSIVTGPLKVCTHCSSYEVASSLADWLETAFLPQAEQGSIKLLDRKSLSIID